MRANLPDIVVHWMSPLPPEETDIAHYTARTLPALAARVRVVCWSPSPYWDRKIERSGALVQYFDPDQLSPADLLAAGQKVGASEVALHAVFIHLGNSACFHGELTAIAQRMPAIVVLHDVVLLEMLLGSMERGHLDARAFVADFAAQYGETGAQALDAVIDGKKHVVALAAEMPGFQVAGKAALGFITHAPDAQMIVSAADSRSNWRLELPYMPDDAAVALRAQTGPLRLLQFGYIGQNRRLLEVLDVLGRLQHEVDFHFDVMGKLWDPDLIAAYVADLGLEQRVTLHGFVEEPLLDACLAQAHLVFNLRHPTMGEASGSQLRIWNAGAAAVVRRAGWYEAAPADTLFHIDDNNDTEADQLRALLLRLDADRSIIDGVGAAGRARLIAAHHPDVYAAEIVKIAQQVPDLVRKHCLGSAFERAGAAKVAPQAIANLRAPR